MFTSVLQYIKDTYRAVVQNVASSCIGSLLRLTSFPTFSAVLIYFIVTNVLLQNESTGCQNSATL